MQQTKVLLRFLFLFVQLSTITNLTTAQVSDLRFFTYSIREGLSNTFVKDVCQDHRGYLWIATAYGLNRYDGYTFKIYNHDELNEHSISDNDVEVLLRDNADNLWVGTANGLCVYNRNTDNFYAIAEEKPSGSGGANHILSLYEDKKGSLLAGTKSGIKLYDPQKNILKNWSGVANLNNVSVYSITEDSSGLLWFGTSVGLIKFNRETGESKLYGEEYFSNVHIYTLYADQYGQLWIGTYGKGLFYFNPEKETFISLSCHNCRDGFIRDNKIRSLNTDRFGNLWVGTEQTGLCRMKLADFKNKELPLDQFECYIDNEQPFSISYRTVTDIFEDRKGNLWIGTHSGGLNLVPGKKDKFETIQRQVGVANTLSHKKVWGICEDNAGRIWAGTDGAGINVIDLNLGVIKHYQEGNSAFSLSDNAIISALKDSEGNLWFGTYAGGLNLYDASVDGFRHFKHETSDNTSISDNDIRVIFEDNLKKLWIGTRSGLCLMRDDKKSFERIKGFEKADIRAIYHDSKNRLWIAVFNQGLKLYNPQTKEIKQHPIVIAGKTLPAYQTIHTIDEDKNGHLWLGTYGGGLLNYNPEESSFSVFSESDGLANNRIRKILKDKNHRLWLSSDKGISMFDSEKKSFTNYGANDGINGLEFHEGSGFKSKSGNLFFGSIDGLVYFNPDSIKESNEKPQILLTDLKIFNKSVEIKDSLNKKSPLKKHISETNHITLNHQQSIFTIEYVSIGFAHHNAIQYAYKLEGLEDEWNYVGNQRSATYTNLKPGNYIFRVKAANEDGLWKGDDVELNIKILPPPWKSWWAYTLYFLVFVILISGLRYFTLLQSQLKNRLAITELANQKEQEMHQLKIQFFTHISHELRTPLTLILSPLEEIVKNIENDVESAKKKLQGIRKHARQLLFLVDQLMNFRKIETGNISLRAEENDIVTFIKNISAGYQNYADQKKVLLNFVSTHQHLNLWFDPPKMEIIINNLLINAFKFTPAGGSVSVIVKMRNDQEVYTGESKADQTLAYPKRTSRVEISVADTGIGIDQQHLLKIFDGFYQANQNQRGGAGLGLTVAKAFIKLHKGDIAVSSEPGSGTVFTLSFPIGSNHLSPGEMLEVNEDKDYVANSFLPEQNEMDDESMFHSIFTATSEEKPHMLIIEDNAEVRALVYDLFKDDFTVHVAAGGIEGVEIALAIIPDIIISDVLLPDKNGIEVCRELKSETTTAHIPVIMLTSRTSDEGILEGLNSGANDYITKPFHPEMLKAKVRNLMQLNVKLKEKFKQVVHLSPGEIVIEPSDEKFLRKVVEIIEANIKNPDLNVKLLVSEMNMSRSVFYRKLHALTEQSAVEFIRSIRMKRASQLLLANAYTIKEVAYESGYTDIKYFRLHFKETFGMNPTEYIQKNNSLQAR